MRCFWLLIFITSVWSEPSYSDSAAETIDSYFRLMNSRAYDATAEFFDSAALAEFRRSMSFLVDLNADSQQEIYSAIYGPEADADSVGLLSDSEFFAPFFAFAMSQIDAAGELDFENIEILGQVAEGPDIAHVVTRMHVGFGDVEIEKMSVISLEKNGGDWKLMMSGNMKTWLVSFTVLMGKPIDG